MAPSEALRSKQLAMFIPAKDLMTATPNEGDLMGNETEDQLWGRKLKESQSHHWNVAKGHKTLWEGQGLHESIASEGVRDPVRLVHHDDEEGVSVAQGHHRIAAAHDIDPEMLVPVVHYGDDEHWNSIVLSEDPYRRMPKAN